MMADVAACVGAMVIASQLFTAGFNTIQLLAITLAAGALHLVIGGAAGIHTRNGPAASIPVVLGVWIGCVTAVLLFVWATKWPHTPPTLGFGLATLVAGVILVTLLRRLAIRHLRAVEASARHATRIAIIGSGTAVDRMAERMTRGPRAHAVVVDDIIRIPTGSNEVATVGLESTLATLDVSAVIICLDPGAERHLTRLAEAVGGFAVDVLADPALLPAMTDATITLGDQRLVALSRRPLRDWRGVAKRAEDLTLGTILTIVIFPIMALIALAIRCTSRGPAIIRQRRFGYANQPIMVRKFRTMYWESGDPTGARATIPGDPRVTPLGRFLRASSLDELPQLFNVLAGDMSLVGPRPHPVEMRVNGTHYHKAVRHYACRHRMKPGITGLAQINGYRGLVDTMEKAEGRLALDLEYIENWSVAYDIDILARTVSKGFINDSAF
jgi:exopolysaccharide biosynthesis polyprenyl glycosylphosphotransferase